MNVPSDQSTVAGAVRIAACACGGLRMTARGEPRAVYACCCVDCQRATGTAFAYRARYALAATTIEGERRTWRRSSAAGRWMEQVFCPTCGVLLFMRAEVAPDMIAISIGAFADPAMPPPRAAYWASRKPFWCDFPDEVALVEEQ